jgi:hypothetical protein
MRQPAGNIMQEAPLAVWANQRQRALDTAIAEINKKTNLNIALESLGRSAHRRVRVLGHASAVSQNQPLKVEIKGFKTSRFLENHLVYE